MIPGFAEQRNPYKGSPSRPWIRVQLIATDGTFHEVELLADTGNPSAIIIGQQHMSQFKHADAPDLNSNFGLLAGGWLHIGMPNLGLDQYVVGHASDVIQSAAKASHTDFDGLAGLPLLRLLEYDGDANWFWLRAAAGSP